MSEGEPERTRRRRLVLGWFADSLAAGLVLGALEMGHVLAWWSGERSAASLTGVAWLVFGFMSLVAALVGPALLSGWAIATRFHALARWRDDVAAGGPARAAALVAAAVVLAALGAFAAFTFALAAWANRAFLEARPIALLLAVVLSGAVAAAALAASEVARRLSSRASRSAGLVRWLGGRAALITLAAAVVVTALLLPAVAQRAAPDGDLGRPAAAAAWFLVALAALRALGPGLRGRARLAVSGVALVLAAAAVTSPAGLRWTEAGRHAVWSQGAASRAVAGRIFSLFDRDGDGAASSLVGGPDCDDGDASVGPLAVEVAGNGRDDNCNGVDAPARAPVPPAPARPAGERLNVLLVTIDALRVDHLGAWGYRRRTSPRLDQLAARSTRFSWALTTTPTTRWALRSIALGRYSSSFGWASGGRTARMPRGPALGESFAAAGYETRSIMCCPWADDMADVVHAGMAQIDQPAASPREKSKRFTGEQVASRVVEFLSARREATRPFFVWTHLIDPHNPYEPRPAPLDFGRAPVDRYDGDVAYADGCLGTILDELERSGLARNTIVLVASDHGEEFGDHGRSFHGSALYSESLRVPLVVHLPGAPPSVVDTPVSLIDVAPTLAELAGVPAPRAATGRSLAAAVRGDGPAPERPILAEVIPDDKTVRNLLAATIGCDKLIWDRHGNVFELYSRCTDPTDSEDRAAAEPEVVERLRRVMAAQVDAELAAPPPAAAR